MRKKNSKKISSVFYNAVFEKSTNSLHLVEPPGPIWQLTREEDNLVKKGTRLGFIEWNEDGTFKKLHHQPSIGFSMILDYHMVNYTWMTSVITEIISENRIRTKNSIYSISQSESDGTLYTLK